MVLFSLLPIPTIPSSSSHLDCCLRFLNGLSAFIFTVYSQNNLSNNNFDLHALNLFSGFLLPYDKVLYSLICFTRPFVNWFFHISSPYITTLPFLDRAILNLFFSSTWERNAFSLRILHMLYLYRMLTPPHQQVHSLNVSTDIRSSRRVSLTPSDPESPVLPLSVFVILCCSSLCGSFFN